MSKLRPRWNLGAVFTRLLKSPAGQPIKAAALKAAKLSKSADAGDRQLAEIINAKWRENLIELAELRGETGLATYLRSTTQTIEIV